MIDERDVIVKALHEAIEYLGLKEARNVREDFEFSFECKLRGRYDATCEIAGINSKNFLNKVKEIYQDEVHESALEWISVPF